MDHIAEAAFLMTGIPVNNRFVDGAKRTLLHMMFTGDCRDIPYVRRMLAPYTMDICVQGIMDCLDHMED